MQVYDFKRKRGSAQRLIVTTIVVGNCYSMNDSEWISILCELSAAHRLVTKGTAELLVIRLLKRRLKRVIKVRYLKRNKNHRLRASYRYKAQMGHIAVDALIRNPELKRLRATFPFDRRTLHIDCNSNHRLRASYR